MTLLNLNLACTNPDASRLCIYFRRKADLVPKHCYSTGNCVFRVKTDQCFVKRPTWHAVFPFSSAYNGNVCDRNDALSAHCPKRLEEFLNSRCFLS